MDKKERAIIKEVLHSIKGHWLILDTVAKKKGRISLSDFDDLFDGMAISEDKLKQLVK